jgi:hypothetical protein
MVEPLPVGEVAIDRLGRGFKVTARLFHPDDRRPRQLSAPDHFATYQQARGFAMRIRDRLRLDLADNTGEAPDGAH